jgi:molybdopterin biosynthesis enzyme
VVGGLAQADALIVVPPEVSQVEAGDEVSVIDLLRVQL